MWGVGDDLKYTTCLHKVHGLVVGKTSESVLTRESCEPGQGPSAFGVLEKSEEGDAELLSAEGEYSKGQQEFRQ